MTAKERAVDLVDKLHKTLNPAWGSNYDEGKIEQAKQCALVCLSEMQQICAGFTKWQYLKDVKQEVNRL